MSDPMLDICNCCEGIEPLTPASLENQPGLSALVYRVGTHGQFKATMQAALAGQPALNSLATREDDDHSIALIDAWATVLDVLSFYQERIANEGYLRTATERRSVLELAREIGYELNPGVAASAYLAFTLETAPGSPEQVTIPIGTKTQSLPGPDEFPQTFETIKPLGARPEWNQFRAKTTITEILDSDSLHVYVAGSNTQLKPGDHLLIVGRVFASNPNSERWDFRRITKVTPDMNTNITRLEWAEGLHWAGEYKRGVPVQQNIRVYVFRQRAALFGHNAPEWRSLPSDTRDLFRTLPTVPAGSAFSPDYVDWPDLFLTQIAGGYASQAPTGTGLLGEYFDREDLTGLKFAKIDPQINYTWQEGGPENLRSDTFSIRWTGQILAPDTGSYDFLTYSDDGVRLWIDGKLLINKWYDRSTPAEPDTTSIILKRDERYDFRVEYYNNTGDAAIKLLWAGPGFAQQVIPTSSLFPPENDKIFLDALYPSIAPDSWVVLVSPVHTELYAVTSVADDARKNFNLNNKATRLTLRGENLLNYFNSAVRETVVFAASEELLLAEAPDLSPIAQDSESITLADPVMGLEKGRVLVVSGLDAVTKEPAAEVLLLERTNQNNTQLIFQGKLTKSYQRDTTQIYANVTLATHGETKSQILGSGDASQPLQRFPLKEAPLTHIAASTPSGAASTLRLQVNEIQWEETPSLFELGPRDRAYEVRIEDDGKAIVQFGDGTRGARPPTGVENIAATYRVGIGLAGMVKAGQLSLLMTRPLGVKGVTNPLPADGAADPENLEEARTNAPFTVLTLDRIVSLQDFEDFARAFAGIGKAQATWLWDGEKSVVHITIAAANSNTVSETSNLYINLRNAIDAARDPIQQILVQTYQPLFFDVEAKILVWPGYNTELVKTQVIKALQQAFGFAARTFGQAVTKSDVLAAIQRVEGVQAVDLDKLYLTGQASELKELLAANIAYWDPSMTPPTIKLAELLTIHSTGIQLKDMTLS